MTNRAEHYLLAGGIPL